MLSELLRAMFDVGYFPPNTPPFSFAVSRSAIIAPCYPLAASRRPIDRGSSACFIARDGGKQALAYVYFADESAPGFENF